MITFINGDIFTSNADAFINTVNCVGVMGKGLALEVKKRYPDCFLQYKNACAQGLVKTGKMHVYADESGKYIINFPTKNHWRYNSQMSYIEEGLVDLCTVIKDLKLKSIAIPALGCSNGGLNWSDVKPVIIKHLAHLDVNIFVYEPRLA